MYMYRQNLQAPQDPWAGDPVSHTALGIRLEVLIYCPLQPRKYQLSNSQLSDISKSVVKDKKLIVHNSHPGAI